jgi:hypothetical protein
VDSTTNAAALPGESVPRMIALVLLLVMAAILECRELSSLSDPEIWGHLRAGTWMLENHAWPRSALFSQVTDTPWRDFSWGYDLLVALAYRAADLRALPALLALLRIGLAVITFLLAGGWRNFWPAVVLSAVSQCVLFAIGPTAVFVSLSFFGIELLLLYQVRRSGNSRPLYLLPFLCLLWVNLDIGVVYGMTSFLLFVVVVFVEGWGRRSNPGWLDRPSPHVLSKSVCLAFCLSLLASCINPYVWHPHVSFFLIEFSPVNRNLPGYTAMVFRQPQDYLLMLLGMAAFLALGLTRSRDLFQILLLTGSAAVAFFARRESWMLVLMSVAVIGRAMLRRRTADDDIAAYLWRWQRLAPYGIALALAFAIFALRVPKDQSVLLSRVAQTFPVRAADFLRQHPQSTPLFNTYLWGEFLNWYLPEYPAAIDARRGLYTENAELDYFKAMNAEIPYRFYPPMNNARTLLLAKADTMGEAFRGVSGFRVIYEDEIAIVYAHEGKE